jgi:hypothetical protein
MYVLYKLTGTQGMHDTAKLDWKCWRRLAIQTMGLRRSERDTGQGLLGGLRLALGF